MEAEANSTKTYDSIEEEDIKLLESMGYKQELNRAMGSVMNFAFGFTEVGVIASFSGAFTTGLGNYIV